MKQRIISGVTIFAFFAAIVIFNGTFPVALNIAISAVSVFCVHELAKAAGLTRHLALYIPSLVVAAAIPFSGVFYEGKFIIYCVYTFIMFLSLIIYYKTITFKDLAIIYSMAIMIPSALQMIVVSRDLSDDYGVFYAVIAVLAAWMPDIGAYFVGTFFGKHKLCPEISPKKTVEGLVGGIVTNVVAMMLFGFIFPYVCSVPGIHINYLSLALIGVGGSITSVVGDLSFSLIKRGCKIKDFAHVIPGHGGFLDRFDSVIFTAPYVFIVLSIIPAVI